MIMQTTLAALKLDRISGELGDLRFGQGDEIAARALQAGDHLVAAGSVGDHIGSQQRIIRPDAHQHIGMIDADAAGSRSRKHHGFKVEMRAEPL